MLRFLVLTLLLANGLYFAWAQNLLQPYGFAPAQQSEPQRVVQQVRPEVLRLLTAQESQSGQAAPSVTVQPPVCLQAGLFDESQVAQLRSALEASLPPATWQLNNVREPARWIVYMGEFESLEDLAKKRAELITLKLKVLPLINPDLEYGLSLGVFTTKAVAAAELAVLTKRGVRTARVVEERPEVRGTLLRLPAADDAIRARLDDIKPALAGHVLSVCQ